jgi:undecaprenyl-diphosphatase
MESSELSTVARGIAILGSMPVALASILVLGGGLWILGRRLYFLASSLLVLVQGLAMGLKELVGRPRPDAVLFPPPPDSASFPSAHAIFAVSFFGFLLYLVSVHVERPRLRIAFQGLLVSLILAMGVSRVYQGVHWPSDILGGYLLGGAFLGLMVWVVRGRWSLFS